jgi:hypothetical protein
MRAIVALYAASVAYSVIRYVAFTPKNAGNIPVFIVNKAVAMAAVLCLALGFLAALRRQRGTEVRIDPATWFRAGTFGAVWHVPMSLVILDPAYFKEFFAPPADPAAAPRLSTAGEFIFMFGRTGRRSRAGACRWRSPASCSATCSRWAGAAAST